MRNFCKKIRYNNYYKECRRKEMKALTDKDLIVFLVSQGFDIKDIESNSSKTKCTIYFENSLALEKSILDFVNKSTTINIADFLAAEKRVKTLLCLKKI